MQSLLQALQNLKTQYHLESSPSEVATKSVHCAKFVHEMENGSSRVPVLVLMNDGICANLLSDESSKQLNLQSFKSMVGFLVLFQLFREVGIKLQQQ